MSKQERKQILPQRYAWLIWAGIVALVILLTSAFSSTWRTSRALRRELATLAPIVTDAVEEQEALTAQLAYVQSDEYVAEWAQTRARMALPGDTLVIVKAATPTAVPSIEGVVEPSPTPERVPFWTRWWHALVGQ